MRTHTMAQWLLSGALLVATVPAAHAQDDRRIVTRLTGGEMERILEQAGGGFEKLDANEGLAWRGQVAGRPVSVFLLNNESSLQFRTWVDSRQRPTPRQAVEWNRRFRFTRAYINNDGEMNIEYDLSLTGGVSVATIRYGLTVMEQTINSVKEEFPGMTGGDSRTSASRSGSGSTSRGLTGTWRIQRGETGDGKTYAGRVEITSRGQCYNVVWELEGGTRYSGVGMLVNDAAFVVAWSESEKESGYGVILYTPTDNGFQGTWCQPNGKRGTETLGRPTQVAGTHRLTSGGSETGTVAIERARGSDTNFELRWRTSLGNYEGYGMLLSRNERILAAVWGDAPGGGVGIYGLPNDDGEMQGWWAAIGDRGQGREVLAR